MDGSTSAQNRKEWAEMFNDPENSKYAYYVSYHAAECRRGLAMRIPSVCLSVCLSLSNV